MVLHFVVPRYYILCLLVLISAYCNKHKKLRPLSKIPFKATHNPLTHNRNQQKTKQ